MKRSLIKPSSDHQKVGNKSLSKGKQKQNNKSTSKISPQVEKSQRPTSKTPPKSSSQKKGKNKTQTQKQTLKKNTLFAIPQVVDTSQDGLKLNVFRQNISVIKEDKIQEKKKEDDFEFDQRSPNFEKSSNKLSQKHYNVSLASTSKPQIVSSHLHTQSKKSLMRQTPSPFRVKTKHEFSTEQQIDEWLAVNLKKTNNESVKKISEQFRQLIQQPLKIQEQLSNSNHPIQRCLIHNTPYSLYCSIDRQLLCVSCIYSSKTHKTHQIIPLAKSQKEMKEDMEGFRNRIDATLAQSESLIRQASLNLIKIQKQYPILLKSIDTYYTRIHAMIDQKKAQQIEYIDSLRDQYKRQLKTINGLLNKISNLFFSKLKQIERQSKAVNKEVYYAKNLNQSQFSQQTFQPDSSQIILNSIVKNRCDYEILSRYNKILTKNSDFLFQERKPFTINVENFDHVVNLIKYKLALVVPVMKNNESKKPWIVELLGEEGARQVGINNPHMKRDFGNKNQQDNISSDKQQRYTLNKFNQKKAMPHKKGFSTSPQVPKGISRRFL